MAEAAIRRARNPRVSDTRGDFATPSRKSVRGNYDETGEKHVIEDSEDELCS